MNTRTTHKKHYILFFAMAMILLLGACSTPGSSQSTGQLLQNSLNAMKQLKAVHVDMKLATTLMGTSNTPSATSTAPRGITVNISASGDEVMPDKTSIHLSLGQGIGNGYSLSEITLGKQIYIQNSKGQWYALNESSLKSKAFQAILSHRLIPLIITTCSPSLKKLPIQTMAFKH